MTISRRQLLRGQWLRSKTAETASAPGGKEAEQSVHALPSDFTPAMLSMQAKAMGLSTEHMSREETEKAILDALNSQQRPEGASEPSAPEGEAKTFQD